MAAITFQHLLALVFILFVLYHLTSVEAFQGVVVGNAYTSMHCVSNNEPLVRFVASNPSAPGKIDTMQCLAHNASGGIPKCLTRLDLEETDSAKADGIPKDIECYKAKQNVNTWISNSTRRLGVASDPLKDSPYGKVFADYGNARNVAVHTCTKDGLLDENHWCGKLYKQIEPECNKRSFERQQIFNQFCENVDDLLKQPSSGKVVDECNQECIRTQLAQGKEQTNQARQNIIRPTVATPTPPLAARGRR